MSERRPTHALPCLTASNAYSTCPGRAAGVRGSRGNRGEPRHLSEAHLVKAALRGEGRVVVVVRVAVHLGLGDGCTGSRSARGRERGRQRGERADDEVEPTPLATESCLGSLEVFIKVSQLTLRHPRINLSESRVIGDLAVRATHSTSRSTRPLALVALADQ